MRKRIWAAVAAAVLVATVLSGFLVAQVVAGDAARSARQQFLTSSGAVASNLQRALQHEEDLDAAAGAFVIATPAPTGGAFLRWTESVGVRTRYPEVLSIAELVQVPAAGLATFAAEAAAGGNPLPVSGGTFQIVPAGPRPYYCLPLVSQARSGAPATLAGLDFCQTTLGPTLVAARDSGQSAYLPYGSGSQTNLAVGTPIYRGGLVPTTVAARRADFLGWTGTQIAPKVLLTEALVGHPQTRVRFRYSDGTSTATFTSASGAVPSASQSTTIALSNGWTVQVIGAALPGGLIGSGSGRALVFGGSVIGLLLAVLVYVLGTSRSRALRLVDERTEELRYQAFHDPLTGLPNRALIMDRIGHVMARSRRDGSTFGVLFLDLDDFKVINDTLGHGVGDRVLVEVATRLVATVRAGDTVGRLGGDEFVVLVEGISDVAEAVRSAERIRMALVPPVEVAGGEGPLVLAVSIGIATGDRTRPEDLLRDADIALYGAKDAGKARAVVFSPAMHAVVEQRRTLATDLRQAVDEHQFFLLYQPVVDLGTGAIQGVEALLRWRHPRHGVMPAGEFIPALESSGLIVPVGRWVIGEACRQGAAWHRNGHRLDISVNLSAVQLEDDRIFDDIEDALMASGLPSGHLALELTETSLMRDVAATTRRLHLLKALGVRIAIDDFGTGYASFSYLQEFPIDVLKIDRAFVSRIGRSAEADSLVRTLVELGRVLGQDTHAEGIETEPQWLMLAGEGVDLGQGYYFARPLDVAGIDRLLDHPDEQVRPPTVDAGSVG